MKVVRCPRCLRKQEKLLALGRVDNKTKICDSCGVEEALDDYFHQPLKQYTVL